MGIFRARANRKRSILVRRAGSERASGLVAATPTRRIQRPTLRRRLDRNASGREVTIPARVTSSRVSESRIVARINAVVVGFVGIGEHHDSHGGLTQPSGTAAVSRPSRNDPTDALVGAQPVRALDVGRGYHERKQVGFVSTRRGSHALRTSENRPEGLDRRTVVSGVQRRQAAWHPQ